MNTKFHPILFSTEMVQAILAGRKTMTRRKMKQQIGAIGKVLIGISVFTPSNELEIRGSDKDGNYWSWFIKCPYGKAGDVLWVRECFRYAGGYDTKPDYSVMSTEDFVYKADEEWSGPFKPSIHMPKSACRIFLKIKSIIVERLQDITGNDVLAEGVDNGKSNAAMGVRWDNMQRMAFEELWKKINGHESWEANHWVWVIQFERIEKPAEFG